VRSRRLVPFVALALVLAGCGGNQNTLAAKSHPQHEITNVFWVVFGFSCFGFGVVVLLLTLGWWRRNRPSLPGGGGERAATFVVIGAGVALPIALLVAGMSAAVVAWTWYLLPLRRGRDPRIRESE
jgi:hypothetical protein